MASTYSCSSFSGSLVAGVYEQAIDRESAYEKLRVRATGSADAAEAARPGSDAGAVRVPGGADP
ncbi:MAG: helicase HerA-like domain-containing protein, partial [Betaproteobacteria bacterium]